MNKKEYIELLKYNLRNYPKDFQDDILDTFENHFQEGIKQGKSEEEIMNSLGSIEEVMENIKSMNTESKSDEFEDNISELGESLKTAFNSFGKIASYIAKNAAEYFDSKNAGYSNNAYQSNTGIIKDACFEVEIIGNNLFRGADVEVNSGDELRYEFQYKESVFLEKSTPIEINVEGDKAIFNIGKNGGKLKLYIPSQINYLKINTSSGKIDISNVNLKELSIKTSLADLELVNSKIDYINADLVSGDIKINNLENDEFDLSSRTGDIDIDKFIGNININSDAGDIKAVNCFSDKFVNIYTSAGDIEYIGNGNEININTNAGDIESEIIDEFKHANIKTNSGDIKCSVQYKNFNLKLNTTFGDVDIDIKECPVTKINGKEFIIGNGEANLSLETTMGDIRVY